MPTSNNKELEAKLNNDQKLFRKLDELEEKYPKEFAEMVRRSEEETKKRITDPTYDPDSYERNPNFSEKVFDTKNGKTPGGR